MGDRFRCVDSGIYPFGRIECPYAEKDFKRIVTVINYTVEEKVDDRVEQQVNRLIAEKCVPQRLNSFDSLPSGSNRATSLLYVDTGTTSAKISIQDLLNKKIRTASTTNLSDLASEDYVFLLKKE